MRRGKKPMEKDNVQSPEMQILRTGKSATAEQHIQLQCLERAPNEEKILFPPPPRLERKNIALSPKIPERRRKQNMQAD
jgi:hypothetical protein